MVSVVSSHSIDIVRNVFPDVDVDHVNQLLNQFNQDVTLVIKILAEEPSYPKSACAIVDLDDKTYNSKQTHQQYDYYTSTHSFVPSKIYIREAIEQLHIDFPCLSYYGRKSILLSSDNHYAICYGKIMDVLKDTSTTAISDNAQVGPAVVGTSFANHDIKWKKAVYDKILEAQNHGKLSDSQIMTLNRLAGITTLGTRFLWKSAVKTERRLLRKLCFRKSQTITNDILKKEIQVVQEKTNDWMDSVRVQFDRVERQEQAKMNNTAIMCACCFDSYHVDDIVTCQDTTLGIDQHAFCVDCVTTMVETKIFSDGNLGYESWSNELSLDLQCFHGSGCIFPFHTTQLEKALPVSLMSKYVELQQQLSITKAGIASLTHACPKCSYRCEVPVNEVVLNCPVSTCQYKSCKICKEVSHELDDCNTFQNKLNARLLVEEAIASALIRKCPVCCQSFIKSDGCNQVRCSCGAIVCYICQKVVEKNHWCFISKCNHTSCNKCGLYTNTYDDDRIAMRQAGLAASLQHCQGNIDIDQILQLISDQPTDNSNNKEARTNRQPAAA